MYLKVYLVYLRDGLITRTNQAYAYGLEECNVRGTKYAWPSWARTLRAKVLRRLGLLVAGTQGAIVKLPPVPWPQIIICCDIWPQITNTGRSHDAGFGIQRLARSAPLVPYI